MGQQITGLDYKIREMAGRIRELREISGFTAAQMAQNTGVSEEEYLLCEQGGSDLNFAFLYRCALSFGVDVTDLIEGSSPKLRSYSLTRAGNGQKIEQAHEMIYYNMASGFKNRIADPLYVENKYSDRAFHSDIELTTHDGQECDLVIKGTLKIQIGEHTETLHEGDCIYFDSSIPHGMVAADGADCLFYAIVLKHQDEIPQIPEMVVAEGIRPAVPEMPVERIADRFIRTEENEKGRAGTRKAGQDGARLRVRERGQQNILLQGHEGRLVPDGELFHLARDPARRPRHARARTSLPVLVLSSGAEQDRRDRDPRDEPAAGA